MQCAILFKTTAEHKSQQQSKLNYYENTNLKLATGKWGISNDKPKSA